mmetsp:Transcript_11913/g.23917  ORF Transcript_11913/g.23917 Transcript_11913/m.23917 type:complete len:201 (+) Transcript_11913:100-702(+)
MGSYFGTLWSDKVAAVCFLEWGIIHVAAMALICSNSFRGKLTQMYKGLYEKYFTDHKDAHGEYDALEGKWPKHAECVLSQHGLNLGWIGVWSMVVPFYVASGEPYAWMMALVPYMADWGYWICLDLKELVNAPAQAQTYIVSTGFMCAAHSIIVKNPGMFSEQKQMAMYGVPALLFGAGIVQKAASFLFGGSSSERTKVD